MHTHTFFAFALVLALALGCDTTGADLDDDDLSGDDDDSTGNDDDAAVPCDPATAALTSITPDDLFGMLEDEEFELINVHIPYAGEIPGTDVHLSYTDVDAIEDHLGYDQQARAVLYCSTGPMSLSAGGALVDRGYCNILDLPGGMSGWSGAGYDLNQ